MAASLEPVDEDSSHLLGLLGLGALGLIAAGGGGGGAAAPAPPPGRPIIDSVSGQRTASGDFLTGKETVDIRGSGALPNGRISVLVDGLLAGTTVADANGKWTYTIARLPDGTHAISVTQTDAAGVTSAPADARVVVDTTAPPVPLIDGVADNVGAIEGLIAQGGSTDDSTPTLIGMAEAGSTLRIFDAGTQIAEILVGADGRWSFTPAPLAEGPHSLTITATDAAGNVSDASKPFSFTVDTTPPLLEGIAVSAGPRPTVTGHAEPGSIVRVFNGEAELGQAVMDAQGNWSFQPKLKDGDYRLTLTATDTAGNQSLPSPAELTVDTTAPMLEVTAVSVAPRPTITGRAEPGSSVKIYNGDTELGQAKMDEEGSWSFQPQLKDGDHDLAVTATDAVGNQSPRLPVELTVDTTPPMLEIIHVSAGASPTITGRAEPGSIVRIFKGRSQLGQAEMDEDGNWHFQPKLLDGEHHLNVTATDAVGNQSLRLPVDLTIDTSPPVEETPPVEEIPPEETKVPEDPDRAEGATATGSRITGSAEPGSIVTILNGKDELGEVVTDAQGHWNYWLQIDDGDYKLTVKATNVEGNYHLKSTVELTVNSSTEDVINVKLQALDTGVAESVEVETSGKTIPAHEGMADESLLYALPAHALMEESVQHAFVEQSLWPAQIDVAHSMDGRIDFSALRGAAKGLGIDLLLSEAHDVARSSALFVPDMESILEMERGAAGLAYSPENAMTLSRETADLERLLAHQAVVV